MLPDIATMEITTDVQPTTLGKSFLFDFIAGDFVIKDGRPVAVTDTQAIKTWVEKIIRTEKHRFAIYAGDDLDEYGVVIEDLMVGHDYPPAFIEAELQREISDALIRHPQISSISDFTVVKDNPRVTMSFTVNLTTGAGVTIIV